MSKREAKLYLQDIKDAIRKIEAFTKGLDYENFIEDSMIIAAVERYLMIIGEAARNIPETIKLKNPHIAWTESIGMRNKVMHEYFGVDTDILWQTIKEDLPILKKQISKLSK